MAGRTQVDIAAERLVQQWRARRHLPVNRSLRAFVGGKPDPGADSPDVRLIEELGMWQGDRDLRDYRVARAGMQDSGERRVVPPFGSTLETQGDPRFEAESRALPHLKPVGNRCH